MGVLQKITSSIEELLPKKKTPIDGTERTQGIIYDDGKHFGYFPNEQLKEKYISKWKEQDAAVRPVKKEDLWASIEKPLLDRIIYEEGKYIYSPKKDVGTKAIGYGLQIIDQDGNPTAYYKKVAALPYNKGKQWKDFIIKEPDARRLAREAGKERLQDFLNLAGVKASRLTPNQLIELGQWAYNAPYHKFKGVRRALLAGNNKKAAYEIMNSLTYHKALLGKAGIDEADIKVGDKIEHFKGLKNFSGLVERWEKAAKALAGSDKEVKEFRGKLKRKWGIK